MQLTQYNADKIWTVMISIAMEKGLELGSSPHTATAEHKDPRDGLPNSFIHSTLLQLFPSKGLLLDQPESDGKE